MDVRSPWQVCERLVFLVDIQGQNEHQELLQPERHLSLVDGFGDDGFKEELLHYQDAYQEYRNLENRFAIFRKMNNYMFNGWICCDSNKKKSHRLN